MKIEQLIKQKENILSNTEKEICKFFINNKQTILQLTLNQISAETFSSNTTVWRTIEKLGFKSFSEFKFSIDWDDFTLNKTNTVEHLSILLHKLTIQLQEEDFEELHTLLKRSRKIFLLYTGYSQKAQAEYFQYTLMKKGKESFMLLNEPYSDLTNLIIESITRNDLVICFSGSGENPELKKWCAVPIMKNVPIVGFTHIGNNWLSDIATFSFSPISSKGNAPICSSLIFVVIEFLMNKFELDRSNL